MIRFACPTCNTSMSAPDDKAGSKGPCPKCGQRVQIPESPATLNKTVLGRIEDVLPGEGLKLFGIEQPDIPVLQPAPPVAQRADEQMPAPATPFNFPAEDSCRRRVSRRRDEPGQTEEGPGGASVTGLVLSCAGAFFVLGGVSAGEPYLSLGLILSVAGVITALCGRVGTCRTVAVVIGAIGGGLTIFMASEPTFFFPRHTRW